MKLKDILLTNDEPVPQPSLSGTPIPAHVECNQQHVYRQLFADFQRQASLKESQLFHVLEQLGKDNQVQRIRFNEANVRVQKLEEALRASEIRAATLHNQLEDERLEHHATRETLRFEQCQHQVMAMEIPPETAEGRLLNQLSRLAEDVNHLKNQQGWFMKEGMLAREMHVKSSSDIMLCVHMAESLGLMRVRIDLSRPLPKIVHDRWTQFNETWNQCLQLTLEGQSEPSQMHFLWPKLMDEKVGLDNLLVMQLMHPEP